ncbi:uncharacterized protein TNCT_279921 [Trichonephila clavata]|uniref:Uncharacterized protein n=1 Tax=Trichonephila clavata TaxID=2740835 RepID=A0A8X6K5K4_TRICU|nr:uncharacterized protein TNCT_279921 [Trichonephila clavata]
MRPGPLGTKVNKHQLLHTPHHPHITTKSPSLVGNTSHINPCYLLENNSSTSQVRFVLEVLTAAGGLVYILDAAKEAQFLGYHTFTQNMMTVPSRVLFMCSCFIMMTMVPLRFTCSHQGEDISAVFVMLTTAPYFLFFCRSSRFHICTDGSSMPGTGETGAAYYCEEFQGYSAVGAPLSKYDGEVVAIHSAASQLENCNNSAIAVFLVYFQAAI